MSDLVRKKLCELINKYGRDLTQDAPRCKALLKDVCANQDMGHINVLVLAVRSGMTNELSHEKNVPVDVLIERISKKMHEQYAIDLTIAHWCTETWAHALGLFHGEGNSSTRENASNIKNPFIDENTEEQFRTAIRAAIAEGTLAPEKKEELTNLRKKLNVDSIIAAKIFDEETSEFTSSPTNVANVSVIDNLPIPTPKIPVKSSTGPFGSYAKIFGFIGGIVLIVGTIVISIIVYNNSNEMYHYDEPKTDTPTVAQTVSPNQVEQTTLRETGAAPNLKNKVTGTISDVQAVSLNSFKLRNSSDKHLGFQIFNPERGSYNWQYIEPYESSNITFDNATCSNGCIGCKIKIATGDLFVEYQVQCGKKYQIYWNAAQLKWDLGTE